MSKMYYETDAKVELIKDKAVAIIGYGSQGHALTAYGILEMIRTGVVGLQRGSGSIYEKEKNEAGILFTTA